MVSHIFFCGTQAKIPSVPLPRLPRLPRRRVIRRPKAGIRGAGKTGESDQQKIASYRLQQKISHPNKRLDFGQHFSRFLDVDLVLESRFDQRHFLHHLKSALTSSCLFGTSVGVLPTIAVRTMFQTGGYDGDMSDELAAMRISA